MRCWSSHAQQTIVCIDSQVIAIENAFTYEMAKFEKQLR